MALASERQHVSVVDKPVDERCGLPAVADHHARLSEFEIRGDADAPALIAVGYYLKQKLGRVAAQRQESRLVHDEQIALLEGAAVMIIDILHVSDLHMGVRERRDIANVVSALLRDLDRLAEQHDTHPLLVMFTGDAVSQGERSYSLVLDEFIMPLLNRLGLDENGLFLVPGNHDVDRSASIQYVEDGLGRDLTNLQTFEDYWRDSARRQKLDSYLCKKFTGYSEFRETISNKHRVISNLYYDAYRLSVGGLSIGIVGLNSAWRSSGFGSDDRRLIVGSVVVEEACAKIGDCDLKVALMHHSLESLTDWDSHALKTTMAQHLNLLFTGHLHDSNSLFAQNLYGKLYISSSAPLFGGRVGNGYSVVRLDLEEALFTVYLRRYYSERREFDQETAKCENGLVTYRGFACANAELEEIFAIARIKRELECTDPQMPMLLPIDLNVPITVEEVFVEPVITDISSYHSTDKKRTIYRLDQIMDMDRNAVFFGGKEYGKTTLLQHVRNLAMASIGGPYETRIPVFISFSDLPRNNPEAITRGICGQLEGRCTMEEARHFLDAGRFVVLVDDFDDRRDGAREKKRRTFLEFAAKYPKCRYILTTTETITEAFRQESLSLCSSLNALDFYLRPLNTAKIRELLTKWNVHNQYDVDAMLERIVYYFGRLQIPVTPMTVTLFLGVLCRGVTDSDIRNEAYLIENYLESVLEKLNPDDGRSEMDFKEKESFLSHLAYAMIRAQRFSFTELEYAEYKSAYFRDLGENLPNEKAFEPFFLKGILRRANGLVSFGLFWFSFFLAKMMQKNSSVRDAVLERDDYLRYSRAIAYKAGLDRNDAYLVQTVSSRLEKRMAELTAEAVAQVKYEDVGSSLMDIGDRVEKVVRNKIDVQTRDEHSDKKHLDYAVNEHEDGPDEVLDDVMTLVTLESDIVRNTTEMNATDKVRHLSANIEHYIYLVWIVAKQFQDFLEQLEVSDVVSLASGRPEGDVADADNLVAEMKRLVFNIIPLSVILYMADHLANPRLANCAQRVLEECRDGAHGLFSVLVLFRLDPPRGLEAIETLVKGSADWLTDSIIHVFLCVYCFEHKVSAELFERVLRIMEQIRKKRTKYRMHPPFPKDTFMSDMRKRMLMERNDPAS